MRVLMVLVAALFCGPAFAEKPAYQLESLMLLQPEFVLEQRASAEDLSNYIKAVRTAAEAVVAEEKGQHPASGYIVLAVRPGGRSKVWLDFTPALPPALDARLAAALGAVVPFQARKGVVVFAINSSLWGAPAAQRPPAPAEWTKAMEGTSDPMEIGELVERIWDK